MQHVEDRVKDLLLKIQEGQVCAIVNLFVSKFINHVKRKQMENFFFVVFFFEGVVVTHTW